LSGPEAAAAFAAWRGHFPLAVTTIVPDGKGGTPTFYLDRPEEVGAFVSEWSGKRNIYYTHARLRERSNEKPKKAHLEGTEFLHADLDPPKDTMSRVEISAWIAETVDGLEELCRKNNIPPPSAATVSGNGLNLLWRLDKFFEFGDPADPAKRAKRIELIEAHTRGICRALGADGNTWNIDRILRLPGGDNLPTNTKRKIGRVRCETSIVYLSDTTHSLDAFPQVWEGDDSGAGGGEGTVAITASLERAEPIRLNDLSELDPWNVPDWLPGTITYGDHPAIPNKWGGDRSRAVFAVTCALIRCGVPPALIVGILIDETWSISDHVRDQSDSESGRIAYAWEQAENAMAEVAKTEAASNGKRVLDPTDPYQTGKRLLEELYPNTIRTNDDWLSYSQGAYRDIEDKAVEADLWRELDAAMIHVPQKKGPPTLERFKPNRNKVGEIYAAMASIAHVPADTMAPPCWLNGDGPDPLGLLPFRNGILNVITGELLAPTPRFFTRNAVDLEYDPSAPEPEMFFEFIEDVLPDPLARELLRDWMGYLLTPDVSQQKILLMVGPPRAGKGVTQRIIRQLVGVGNTCNPLSSDMGSGGVGALQTLIGKSVAFMSDARFNRTANSHAITERLLTISGGDPITISRKYKGAWDGQLPTRFVMLTNELPELKDNSPALANRFVPLLFEKSFLGREDPTLADRIIANELPGILNWALEGCRRLRQRGRFVLPQVSEDAISKICELGSPVASFVRQYCVIDPNKQIDKRLLFDKWKQHRKENDEHHGSLEQFARDLYAATSHKVKDKRLAADASGYRPYVFVGIDLRRDNDPY